jgi:hypothetical protein
MKSQSRCIGDLLFGVMWLFWKVNNAILGQIVWGFLTFIGEFELYRDIANEENVSEYVFFQVIILDWKYLLVKVYPMMPRWLCGILFIDIDWIWINNLNTDGQKVKVIWYWLQFKLKELSDFFMKHKSLYFTSVFWFLESMALNTQILTT